MDIPNLINESDDSHVLSKEKKLNSVYYNDFLVLMEKAYHSLKNNKDKNKIFGSIIEEKLQIGKSKFNYKQYIQSASEISVLAYFLGLFKESFIYEPRLLLDSNKNVECQFEIIGIEFNIEVKTPEYRIQEEQDETDSIKIGSVGRFDKKTYNEVSEELKSFFSVRSANLYEGKMALDTKRMDNTAKTFLCEAQNKFPEISNQKNYNILVICLDDLDSIGDWVDYFYHNQGLFTPESFVPHEKFDKVDLVILTNLYHKHNRRKTELPYAWDFSKSFNLFLFNEFASTPKMNGLKFAHSIVPNFTDECREFYRQDVLPIKKAKRFYYEYLRKKIDFSMFH